MNRRSQTIKYVVADVISAFIAWTLFYLYRKYTFNTDFNNDFSIIFQDLKFYIGIIIIPLCWLLFYASVGTYSRIFRKTRMRELGQTLFISLLGVIILFFVVILDDEIGSYTDYYKSFFILFSLHFFLTFFGRFIMTTSIARKIRSKQFGFNTIIVGSNGNATNIYNEIKNQEQSSGNLFVGFVNVNQYKEYLLSKHIPHLGFYTDLSKLVKENNVEEVIIAIERSEFETISNIIAELEPINVIIKIVPITQDFLTGAVKTTSIFHTPLIQISGEYLPVWQKSIKRTFDIVMSIFAMIILSPMYVICAIGVKLSSKGPFIYSQERIGINGKAFMMYKFRSMYIDAEKTDTPQLSSENDPRITKFGKFLRKVRLDETPQFYSVLIGDMSIVGPRPERQYFIDQIVKRAPHYRLTLRIKPGITGWGQVKYGYAENVSEMVERLKYEILYLENMSLAMDFKILIYTVLIVIQGRGK